jgi:hypothetical protein
MKRKPRLWTKDKLALLGALPGVEVAELTGRTFGTVWQKRRALGIEQPALHFRKWTPAEDKLVGTAADADIAQELGRTESAIKSRRAILDREQASRETKPILSDPKPCRAVLVALGARPITVPRDPSLREDDRYRLIDGPYYPPRTARGRFLICQLRGKVKVGGYSDAPIPWPRIWRRRSLVICGDLLRALRTESVYAVSYHWGLSRAIVSYYRQQLSIPRHNPGTYRLFREIVIEAARTPEARAKLSAATEGKRSTESPHDRERLRRIQRRPKSKSWRKKMSERLRRRFDLLGPYRPWAPRELAMIGTMPDRKVARRINRSLSAVRGKKFSLHPRPK